MRILLHKKIKAGALQYTLFVSVVILILIATFITLTFLQNQFKTKSDFYIQSIQMADYGFSYLAIKDIPYQEELKIELKSDLESQLVLQKKHWGVFDLIHVKSTVNEIAFQKIGLSGGYFAKKPALYLKDNNKALVVVGNTKIQGAAYLPQKRTKRGNIAGHSYYGNQLIYGPILQSETKLPKLRNREYLKELSKGVLDNLAANHIELFEGFNKVNSFTNPVNIYKQYGVIKLTDIQLTGNYVIQSDTLIQITNTALLKDVLILAPHIEIMDGTKGNFQAIASKKIIVGSNCHITYPSSLVVYSSNKKGNKSAKNSSVQLTINSNSSIIGCVAFLSENEESNYNSQLLVAENSTITGIIFCDGNMELKGRVFGSVYTANFIAKEFGSVFQNHIFNGHILQNELPQQFVGFSFENTMPKVSKWLY